jgi:hypothetical protein
MSGPPGTSITIYGERFAHKVSDNQITIGGAEAPVNGGSRDRLVTVIPMSLNGQSPTWGAMVVVKSGGLSSNEDVTIRVQSRMY